MQRTPLRPSTSCFWFKPINRSPSPDLRFKSARSSQSQYHTSLSHFPETHHIEWHWTCKKPIDHLHQKKIIERNGEWIIKNRVRTSVLRFEQQSNKCNQVRSSAVKGGTFLESSKTHKNWIIVSFAVQKVFNAPFGFLSQGRRTGRYRPTLNISRVLDSKTQRQGVCLVKKQSLPQLSRPTFRFFWFIIERSLYWESSQNKL